MQVHRRCAVAGKVDCKKAADFFNAKSAKPRYTCPSNVIIVCVAIPLIWRTWCNIFGFNECVHYEPAFVERSCFTNFDSQRSLANELQFLSTAISISFGKIHKQQLDDAGLASFCGTVMNSVALKLYKPEWSGGPQAPLDAPSRIFFSIWVNEHAVKENKLFYNIHALKLRQRPGYKIASREFAENFRTRFSPHAKDWSNVSIKFGPLTLMQGWRELENESISNDIFGLTAAFLTISPLIDATLSQYKIR